MVTRKRIGLIIQNPESVYQQRIIDGVFAQCEKYGYDVSEKRPAGIVPAEKIASEEVPMPKAVICANIHFAVEKFSLNVLL
jgi:DNA-binding LacI/PurR family transcriptional regulator